MSGFATHCARRTIMAARAGQRNLITDVAGILVGQAEDRAAISGTTVVLAEAPAVASVDVRGGAPGGRETELLAPGTLVERIDAIVLSGGSAFGLDAGGDPLRPRLPRAPTVERRAALSRARPPG